MRLRPLCKLREMPETLHLFKSLTLNLAHSRKTDGWSGSFALFAHAEGTGRGLSVIWRRGYTSDCFMPISPSDLPWWGWFLCSIGALGICGFCWMIARGLGRARLIGKGLPKVEVFATLASIVSGFLAFVLALVGIIRFVKWVWAG